jgi:hypothetical protein
MTVGALRAGLLVLWAIVAIGAPAAAQSVSVTAADPASGSQDTVGLVVKITGKNFAPGARAAFLLAGTTNPGGITVRGTSYVSSTTLDVVIDIADTASLAYFDIRVTNTNGRSGKGSDLFKVVEKSAPASVNYTFGDSFVLRDAAPTPGVAGSGDGVVSDGLGPYMHGTSGLEIKIFTAGTGDLTANMGTARTMRVQTVGDRLLSVLGSPYPLTATPGTALWVGNIWSIPVPEPGTQPVPVLRAAVFGHATGNFYYGTDDGAGAYSTKVYVTRHSKTSWTISSDNTPGTSAYSTKVSSHPPRTGLTAQYALPFSFTVTCSQCAGVN